MQEPKHNQELNSHCHIKLYQGTWSFYLLIQHTIISIIIYLLCWSRQSFKELLFNLEYAVWSFRKYFNTVIVSNASCAQISTNCMQLRINAAINYTFYIHANFMIQLNLACEKQISVAIASNGRKKETHYYAWNLAPFFSHKQIWIWS